MDRLAPSWAAPRWTCAPATRMRVGDAVLPTGQEIGGPVPVPELLETACARARRWRPGRSETAAAAGGGVAYSSTATGTGPPISWPWGGRRRPRASRLRARRSSGCRPSSAASRSICAS